MYFCLCDRKYTQGSEVSLILIFVFFNLEWRWENSSDTFVLTQKVNNLTYPPENLDKRCPLYITITRILFYFISVKSHGKDPKKLILLIFVKVDTDTFGGI